jgi:UrcA family protein
MRKVLIPAAALALFGTAANTSPITVTSGPVPAVHVSIADLNLNSRVDRTLLKSRIRAAAETLCAIETDRTADSALGGRGCYQAAVANGVRQMNDLVAQRAERASGRQ